VSLVELVVETHDLLDDRSAGHAFGGALALAYYAEPRGTADVDVNVFLPFSEAGSVVPAFEALGLRPERRPEDWLPLGGVRLVRPTDPAPLDLFFSVDQHYDEIAARTRRFPFGLDHREMPFLSAEDLAVFKLSFGRDQDWVDLRRLVGAQRDLDLAYVERQLIGIRGPTMYPRIVRLRTMARAAAAPDA
jgi:hypothetical protein